MKDTMKRFYDKKITWEQVDKEYNNAKRAAFKLLSLYDKKGKTEAAGYIRLFLKIRGWI